MKHFLVVAAGCFPLIWLTASNLWDWQRGATPGLVPEQANIRLSEMHARASSLSLKAAGESEFVASLVSMEPFSEIPWHLPSSRIARKELTESWERYIKAHDDVLRVVRIYADGRWPERDELTKLDALVESIRSEALPTSSKVERWLQDRRNTIEKKAASEAKLDEIRSFLVNKKYDAVLGRMDQLHRESLSDAERLEMRGIEREAKFENHWKDFARVPIPPVLAEARRRVEKLKMLLNSCPSLLDENDEVVNSRKNFVDDREKELTDLQCRVKIDEVFEITHREFSKLARDTEPILQEYGTRPRLQEKMKQWIAEQFEEKKPPLFESEFQEVKDYNGKYRRGIFKECVNFNNLPEGEKFYKYWKHFRDFKNGRPYEDTVYAEKQEVQPGKMLEVRLCGKYNEQRIEALRLINQKTPADKAKDEWKRFSASCKDHQRQITDYYQTVMPDDKGVSFEIEARLTDEIETNWDLIKLIFYPDPV
jgi:hypothetical protein